MMMMMMMMMITMTTTTRRKRTPTVQTALHKSMLLHSTTECAQHWWLKFLCYVQSMTVLIFHRLWYTVHSLSLKMHMEDSARMRKYFVFQIVWWKPCTASAVFMCCNSEFTWYFQSILLAPLHYPFCCIGKWRRSLRLSSSTRKGSFKDIHQSSSWGYMRTPDS
jgi:hypothetical protein